MSILRNNQNEKQSLWSNYVGDILRGNQPINQLIPQHPYIDDIPLLNELNRQRTQHIVLLTIDDARKLFNEVKSFDYVNFFTTYTVNIKDSVSWLRISSNLMSEFDETGRLTFRLNSLLHTKASYIELLGVKYIKITTSSYWLLDKIGKTILSINAPQVLELAIGLKGIISETVKGIKLCIWFSVGLRIIQFAMSSEHNLINFLGDISMDITKTLIAGGMATIIGTLVSSACLAFGGPIILVTATIVATGIACTYALNKIDDHFKLSEKLKVAIKDAVIKQQQLTEWKMKNLSPLIYSLTTLSMNGAY